MKVAGSQQVADPGGWRPALKRMRYIFLKGVRKKKPPTLPLNQLILFIIAPGR
jgi:hypothetical protein